MKRMLYLIFIVCLAGVFSPFTLAHEVSVEILCADTKSAEVESLKASLIKKPFNEKFQGDTVRISLIFLETRSIPLVPWDLAIVWEDETHIFHKGWIPGFKMRVGLPRKFESGQRWILEMPFFQLKDFLEYNKRVRSAWSCEIKHP